MRTDWTSSLLLFTALAVIGLVSQPAAASAEPMQIYAAGSLKPAMQALISESGLPAADFAKPVFGPAGLLGERLSKGETADLFASADMTQPNRLASANKQVLVVPFAGNRMCVAARLALGLTPSNILDKIVSPDVRLATSTPGADPGGDYAMAVFDKADAIRAGAGAILRTKALHLLGAPNTMGTSGSQNPAAAIFLGDHADALLYYCSGARDLLKDVPGLVNVTLPEALEVYPTYGLAVLSDNPEAARFGLFVLSSRGQSILTRFGFRPIAKRD